VLYSVLSVSDCLLQGFSKDAMRLLLSMQTSLLLSM